MLNSSKTYRVDKLELLKKIKANRTTHVAEFKASKVAYREKAIEALARQIKLAEAGKKFSLVFDLPRPFAHTKEYDRVIGLLELSTDTHIDITAQDYQQYIEDEWHWKTDFANNSKFYGATGATGAQGSTGPTGASGSSSDEDDDSE